ncbi:hypothetical protein L6164_019375 [Bauhinia variegata]|nr:hypothetical protein L6164_019375 [Bauhinia variegata]
MEELAQEFRKKLEDHIRLLYRRIHVAEQLHNENKESYKIIKKIYEEENGMLKEKIAGYEDELRKPGVMKMTPMELLNGLELAAGLDLAAGKLEEHKEFLLSRVSKMVGEVQNAKDWIKKRNSEMKQLKDNVNFLTALLDDKEEQEFLLREKVWKLEAKVSKEGGEKLNLMKTVRQLEKKMGKLEKIVKEKDEELVHQGEQKREAIRQLCFLNDYHRNRCDYLKDLITNMRVSTIKRT